MNSNKNKTISLKIPKLEPKYTLKYTDGAGY